MPKGKMQTMERVFQERHISVMTRLTIALVVESEQNKNEQTDFLGMCLSIGNEFVP